MRARLTIDTEAVAANWRMLAATHGAPTGAVVKADGYGLGAAVVARALHAAGCRHFFVGQVEEGLALRPLLPGAAIVVLGGFCAAEAGAYSAHALMPALGEWGEVAAFGSHCRHVGRALPAFLHVDTGMNRLGLPLAEARARADTLHDLDLRCLMTHLVSSEAPEDGMNELQLQRFAAAREAFPGLPTSIANSSGIFLGPRFASDLARPGAALYGLNPTPGQPNPMRPTVRLTAPVLQLRDVPVGETVGYNATFTAARATRVATVGYGYADGYHRSASGRGWAVFDGARLPLIGRVSMDLLTFDATDAPALAVGDEVELLGPALPPDEAAGFLGTSGYEVLTSLGARAARIYRPL